MTDPRMTHIDPAEEALFLDFDGTLVDMAPLPEAIHVPPDLVEHLDMLQRMLAGALALVSGRPIAVLDRYLAPLAPVAAGIHGAELRATPHSPIEQMVAPLSPAIIAQMRDLAAREPGAHLEYKRLSVAIHRGDAARIEAGLRHILAAQPEGPRLQQGRNVWEILPGPVSKGEALERIMTLPAFRGRRPVMIGDDVTDLSAFSTARRLGGRALKVAGGLFSAEESAFASPAHVRDWLAERVHVPCDQ